MRGTRRTLAVAVWGVVSVGSVSMAADRTWIGETGNGNNGTFQTASHWLGGIAPTTSADRAIFAGSTISRTITFNGSVSNGSLSIDNNLNSTTLNFNGGTYTLANTGSQCIFIDAAARFAGGRLNAAGGLLATGTTGNESVIVRNTATLTLGGNIVVDELADFNCEGFASTPGSFIASDSPGAATSATVSGTLQVGAMTIARDGSSSLSVTGTAQTSFMTLGSVSGSVANVTINGSLGSLSATTAATFGSSGSAIVTNTNGSLSMGRASLGESSSGVGSVMIGTGTIGGGAWNVGTILTVGNLGRGDVLIFNASSLTVGSNLNIGSGSSGTGTLRIEGDSFASLASITIGRDGDGTMTVRSNSVAQTGPVVIANTSGSTGTLTVQGIGAVLDAVGNSITVGAQGAAQLNILDGGRIRCGNVSTAAGAAGGGLPDTGIATITVGGGGALWDINGTLGVGSFDGTETVGTAVMNINAGGSVAATSDATVFPGSTLNLNGGSFSAQRILISATGSPAQFGQFNFNSGTVSVATLTLSSSPFALLAANFVSDRNHALITTGTLTIPGATSITMRGGYLSSSTLSIGTGGELILDDPSSSLLVGTQLVSSGTIRGDGRIDSGFFTALNNSGGEIRASLGDRIEFTRAVTNNGLVNLLGGEMEFGTTFTNAATGRVTGRGMLMATNIVNTGSMLFSAGLSDVFGTVANNSGGKIIVSGAGNTSFYDPVTNNAGSEFRVSTNSTASFFSPVVGLSFFTGTGVKIFESSAVGGPLVNGGSSIVGPAGAVTASFIRETTLTINGGDMAILPNGTNASTSRLSGLQIAGAPGAWDGQLDLANNALVVDYSLASPIAIVGDQIKTGFAGGSWNGQGILSSVAASTPNRAIGLAEASDLGSPATFAGQSIDSTSILVRFTILGDANLDRIVDIGDFALLAANFNSPTRWSRGDFNYNGMTEIGDFALLAANFNQALPIDLPRGLPAGSSVPEPVGALSILGLSLAIPRRRR